LHKQETGVLGKKIGVSVAKWIWQDNPRTRGVRKVTTSKLEFAGAKENGKDYWGLKRRRPPMGGSM